MHERSVELASTRNYIPLERAFTSLPVSSPQAIVHGRSESVDLVAARLRAVALEAQVGSFFFVGLVLVIDHHPPLHNARFEARISIRR